MDPSKVNWLAVFVAALSSFVLGGLWYSPLLFGKRWQKAVGISDEELGRGAARVFGVSALLALVSATNLAFFLGPEATLGFGVAAGAAAGIGWVATGLSISYLFARRPLSLILIDAGYQAVVFVIMGAILGAWH